MKHLLIIIFFTFGLGAPLFAEEEKETLPIPELFNFTTDQRGTFGGERVDYEAVVSNMLLKNGEGEVYAEAVTTAYLKKGEDNERPVTFVFNGGPGSASVWLHMGVMGPKVAQVPSDAGDIGLPPYTMIDNPLSPMELTDIVFIDPIGTGYSRLAGVGEPEDVWGLEEDGRSVAQIIREWVRANNRWNAPIHIVGESFGTTRVGAMLPYLQGGSESLRVSGVVLVSQALDYTGSSPWADNLVAFVTYLPTQAATAWYHNKLENRPESLEAYLEEVRAFATDEYLPALFKGTSLSEAEFNAVATKYARYTGLDVDYVKRSNLRVLTTRFSKELLRDEGLALGRLDSRYTNDEFDEIAIYPRFDASSTKTGAAYSSIFHAYMRNNLGVTLDRPYHISGPDVNEHWVWDRDLGGGEPEFVNTAPDFATEMVRNPAMKVLLASGYYDNVTPFFDAEYTFWRHGIDMDRVEMTYYEGGHMMYLHEPALDKLGADIRRFLEGF